jgi:hypothetical protein
VGWSQQGVGSQIGAKRATCQPQSTYDSTFHVPSIYNTCTYPYFVYPYLLLSCHYYYLIIIDYIWTQNIILSFNYLSIKYISVLYIGHHHLSFTSLSVKYMYHKLSLLYSIFTVKYLFNKKIHILIVYYQLPIESI